MNKMIPITKFSLSLVLALGLLLIQAGGVFAAPFIQKSASFTGLVQSITLETDTITGVTIVSVDVIDAEQSVQTIRLSQESAITLGLVVVNGDGKPTINDSALGKPVEIDTERIIPVQEENQHPVATALATFFSDINGMDYEMIMAAHEQGIGFGVIAQTLWLTTKLEGDAAIFETLIEAKQTGDFSDFILENGSSPENWGQLKKAILDQGKPNSVGVVVSNSDRHGNGNNQSNNGNGSENGNGANNDNGKGNGNHGGGKDKDNGKDKNPKK
jgi:hypothetical protein